MTLQQLSTEAERLSFCPTGSRTLYDLWSVGWEANGAYSFLDEGQWIHVGWSPQPGFDGYDYVC